MTQHNVRVGMTEITEPGNKIYFLEIAPERVLLSGNVNDTIQWTVTGGTFTSAGDVSFITQAGQDRFVVGYNNGVITATITAPETDETIYTYLLTVHGEVDGTPFAIRVDPEVDNPPPPPGGP